MLQQRLEDRWNAHLKTLRTQNMVCTNLHIINKWQGSNQKCPLIAKTEQSTLMLILHAFPLPAVNDDLSELLMVDDSTAQSRSALLNFRPDQLSVFIYL